MNWISQLEAWQSAKTEDKILELALAKIKPEKAEQIFSQSLTFGTAGIRGKMGPGTNMINVHTISAAAHAYGTYLQAKAKSKKEVSIVIGHDNRHNSALYARTSAQVLMDLGIRVYLYKDNEMQPTPFVSYTIRKLKLSGGIMITASHNPKEYNGFKVYNQSGGQLMPWETKEIASNMKGLDLLAIKKSNKNPAEIKDTLVEEYLREVLSVQIRKNDSKVVKVVFSPQHGAARVLGPEILSQMNVEYKTVKDQMTEDPNFSKTATPNPEDVKSYIRGLKLARKTKSDMLIVTDPDADRLGIVVKHKKRFKYLNGNQLAALYLEYYLSQLKSQNKLVENGYIITSNVSGLLAKKIAQKFKLKVYETHVGFKNIAHLIQNNKEEKFVFAYEESYGMLINSDISRDKDALQALVGVVEMANYYLTQGKDLYDRLKELYKTFGIYRSTIKSRVLSDSMTNGLLKRIAKVKTVHGQRVTQVDDYRNDGANNMPKANLVKITLESGSWFAIRPSGTEPKVKIYIQSVGTTSDELMDVIIFEQEIENLIVDNTEDIVVKQFGPKFFFKYVPILLVIIAILYFVFANIYQSSNNLSLLEITSIIFSSQLRIFWAIFWAGVIFLFASEAWIRKRLFMAQGVNVNFRHLIVSGIMGSVVAYITPFAIGGDAVGYWYLKRKGIKRGAILATLMSATIFYQMKLVLQTIILVPIGFPIYVEIFSNGDISAQIALIFFIIGLAWNIFATFMIFSLTLWRSFQNWIIRNLVHFLEWSSIVRISDPVSRISKIQYGFREMRNGMGQLWTNKLLVGEMFVYIIAIIFLNFNAIASMFSGWILPDLPRGPYLTQIITNDIITTANSLSLTPGGSGTGEWLSITINNYIFNPKGNGANLDSGLALASGWDFMLKVLVQWPKIIMSALMLFTIFVGEKRRLTYASHNKNKTLLGKAIRKSDTSFYKRVFLVWGLLIAVVLTFYFTVPIPF